MLLDIYGHLYVYIHIILHSVEKEECPAIYNCMGEHGEHYNKWNKPDREKKNPSFDMPYTWNLKKDKLTEWCLPKAKGRVNEKCWLKCTNFQL